MPTCSGLHYTAASWLLSYTAPYWVTLYLNWATLYPNWAMLHLKAFLHAYWFTLHPAGIHTQNSSWALRWSSSLSFAACTLLSLHTCGVLMQYGLYSFKKMFFKTTQSHHCFKIKVLEAIHWIHRIGFIKRIIKRNPHFITVNQRTFIDTCLLYAVNGWF